MHSKFYTSPRSPNLSPSPSCKDRHSTTLPESSRHLYKSHLNTPLKNHDAKPMYAADTSNLNVSFHKKVMMIPNDIAMFSGNTAKADTKLEKNVKLDPHFQRTLLEAFLCNLKQLTAWLRGAILWWSIDVCGVQLLLIRRFNMVLDLCCKSHSLQYLLQKKASSKQGVAFLDSPKQADDLHVKCNSQNISQMKVFLQPKDHLHQYFDPEPRAIQDHHDTWANTSHETFFWNLVTFATVLFTCPSSEHT